MPDSLLKRRYKQKHGRGCKMCKPQKGGWSDHRTLQDIHADQEFAQQIRELRSVAQK